jgi:hypothetical protein
MMLARHDTTDRMELFDEHGRPLGCVTLPSDPRLFGPDKGTVFLNRPLPILPELAHPAQAA